MVKLERSGIFGGSCRSFLSPALQPVRYSGIHNPHKDQRDHGRRRSQTLSAINFSVVKDMMLTWIFTFPGCGLISFVMAKLFMLVF